MEQANSNEFAFALKADGLGGWRADLISEEGASWAVGAFATVEAARAAAERHAQIAMGLRAALTRARRRDV